MRMGTNRRLANQKTRKETGLDYVMQNLNILTPFGKKELKELRPYFPGEEDELREELAKVDFLVGFCKEKPVLVETIQEIFMETKDLTYSVERAEKNTLSVVEIYDIKSMLLLMGRLNKVSQEEGQFKIPTDFVLDDTTELLDDLDPRRDRINTFYIYDEFSEVLGQLRGKKRALELEVRREQKTKREEIRKNYGVQLTPKFDICVSKSNAELDKICRIPELEEVDQDYMSVTFQLKPTEKIFDYVREMDAINEKIDEEEERICELLSKKIAQYKEVLIENFEKIGKLDFSIAKALYAIKHQLVKPEIVEEHIIEIEEGRNLQVEDILKERGITYCPVSIGLKDGVTCITGANMGGKTISLKLSGQVPMLAQYGFFVGAKSAKVGLSNYMQILIGDSQSVERGLSSFGSEMEELKEILDRSMPRSILLIDEIASGTNPSEGLGLTRSLVDYLIKKPYISLITTHFETVTETEGVINMQVKGLSECNFQTLNREIQYANRRERINIISKYMDYRLVRVEKQGEVPKDALNIAKMLGISAEIIEGAQKYIK